ncbi:MAG: LytR C-terminal domain-containing protein [Fibrobacter sp.]|uniref:LytR C-terminal domain-containing protein n=1 Tax=Fibrobacter sp. TaxID=35828 RepID=UPI0015671E5E|nr:LytR C-terminal domain-containing protein [Fibrobacter sp.]MBR4785382.1 LytR C-terminal domain-containing protein [Fibrobacter sp.]
MYRKFAKAVHYTFLAGAVCAASLLQGCEDEKKAPTEQIVRSYKGDVEVLNSCGEPGAAAKMRSFLRKNGFDVVSFRNDVLQNYDETIVVLRNPEWEGAQALAKTLQTKNVLTVVSKRSYVDAAVYIGKDFKQIIEPEQGETNDD